MATRYQRQRAMDTSMSSYSRDSFTPSRDKTSGYTHTRSYTRTSGSAAPGLDLANMCITAVHQSDTQSTRDSKVDSYEGDISAPECFCILLNVLSDSVWFCLILYNFVYLCLNISDTSDSLNIYISVWLWFLSKFVYLCLIPSHYVYLCPPISLPLHSSVSMCTSVLSDII